MAMNVSEPSGNIYIVYSSIFEIVKIVFNDAFIAYLSHIAMH